MDTTSKSDNKVREIDKKISILEQKLINEQDQCSISDLAKICETINNLEEQKRRLLRASGSIQPSNDSMTEDQRAKAESILQGPNAFIRPDLEKLLIGKELDKNFDACRTILDKNGKPISKKIEPRVIEDYPCKEEDSTENSYQLEAEKH